MNERKPIGQLLKERGFITEEYIRFALLEQKATRERLGEILTRLGLVTELEVARVLAEQAGLPFEDLSTVTPDPKALLKVSPAFAKQREVLPLRIEEGALVVALSDPFNFPLQEAISRVSGMRIKPVVAARSQINRASERFYYFLESPPEKELEKVTERLRENPNAEVNIEDLIEKLLIVATGKRATDIHITPSEKTTQVFFRIDGVLEPFWIFPRVIHSRLIGAIKVRAGMDIAEVRLPQDGRMHFAFLGEEYDLRVSTVRTPPGENMVIRILPVGSAVHHLSTLGFTEEEVALIKEIFERPYGMFLVTGPTGSGKTTTLYAGLRLLNLLEKNVLTAEDPIEYRLPLARQTQVNEEAGYTFARAIRHFLRQDPDVILVGEVRDEETAEMAVRSALTGHLFLSTLHTNDALSTIYRLKDLGISSDLLASSLLGASAQRLIRKLCPYCREEYHPPAELLTYYNLPRDHTYFRGKGCEFCGGRGYLGRIVVTEIFRVSNRIRALIAEDAPLVKIAEVARGEGMKSLRDSAREKVLEGITTVEEIRRVIG
ncbi:GspE/PulE family protein [Thermosulfurimonas dismutans]|uniref:Type IV fimbrial assembly, ATPase PilB n=1 Tax=Thermosulfurimonas dismutans TaxID=999894 RepID=A0A179D536_9BACT|nr:GspE/PulE family protein [Thermosulfurimonas dismutans]OAQ20572.1 Type IV fimbrial assembly, ATPase PilB [Thermosulfurimonas dismutans]